MTTPSRTVSGRNCNGCAMCCKLPRIDELAKPRHKWCAHCEPTRGCKIYATRPDVCRQFECGYLTDATLSEDWKPSKSKLLVQFLPGANTLGVHVDPSRPDTWRQEPFYSEIKRWARNAVAIKGQVVVWTGARTIAILPDRDKDLGELREGQVTVTAENAAGDVVDVFVVDEGHPLAVQHRERSVQSQSPTE